jgi:NFU1 iron-sulfur cluster scaffold homolog, mitochondrial
LKSRAVLHILPEIPVERVISGGASVFIQTEDTPNPATLKFIPGQTVMPSGTIDFSSADGAARSPLARRLFAVEGVARVFFGSDFITVTKAASNEWHVMKPALLGAIMEHFTSGQPVLPAAESDGHAQGGDSEVVAQIKELLDTRVRPAVAQDGGDILFSKFDPATGVVWLNMRGACSGCPSSTATLKAGVENMLKHYVPEVTRVEQTL